MRKLTEKQIGVLAYLSGKGRMYGWRVVLYAKTSPAILKGMVDRGLLEKFVGPDRNNPGKLINSYCSTKKGDDAWKELEKPIKIIELAMYMKDVMAGRNRHGPKIHW